VEWRNERRTGSIAKRDRTEMTLRQLRALDALWHGPRMREELDRIAGCSNSPNLVRELALRGVGIACDRVGVLDRDGRPCKPGRYSLTDGGRERLRAWGWR